LTDGDRGEVDCMLNPPVRRYGRDAGASHGAFAGGEARGQFIGWAADAIPPPGSVREDIAEAAPCP
jgi:hypothetical protein